MAYKALYRVYRPRKFEDVYGQEHITAVLKNQVRKNNLSHAYIFAGPRGTGKTSVAKILANAVNCLHPVEGSPCGECENCKAAQNDNFVDIIEMDAASNNGVDNIRELREKVGLLPAAGKYKVYIIDEVHMLSGGAFNALLKTIEEPPAHAMFILATTELRKLPKTIISRCQQFDFKRISDEDIEKRLEYVAADRGIAYEKEAIEIIAKAAEGAMRDALSIMDMCIAGEGELTANTVNEAIGYADSSAIKNICEYMIKELPGECFCELDKLFAKGVAPEYILKDLISCHSEKLGSIQDQELLRKILKCIEALIEAQGTLRYSPTPKAHIQAAVLRGAVPATDTGSEDLISRVISLEARVERLEKAVQNGVKTKTPKTANSDSEEGKRQLKMAAAELKQKNKKTDENDPEKVLASLFGSDEIVIKD